ncbi:MAG: hypothetical protein AAFV07_14350, partial [Bacteroidota bacterium]
ETRKKAMRLVRHFISVYGQAGNTLILDGLPTEEKLRHEITNFLRMQQARLELHYWEVPLEKLANSHRANKKVLTAQHAEFAHPHPWEFHQMQYMTV